MKTNARPTRNGTDKTKIVFLYIFFYADFRPGSRYLSQPYVHTYITCAQGKTINGRLIARYRMDGNIANRVLFARSNEKTTPKEECIQRHV